MPNSQLGKSHLDYTHPLQDLAIKTVQDAERSAKNHRRALSDVQFYAARLIGLDIPHSIKFPPFAINIKDSVNKMFRGAEYLLNKIYDQEGRCRICASTTKELAAGYCFDCFCIRRECQLDRDRLQKIAIHPDPRD